MIRPVARLFGFLLALAIVASGADAASRDVGAGPIWNNLDAQKKCPAVCTGAGGRWDGNWRTVIPGQQSVCSCDVGRAGAGGGAAGGQTMRVQAGPIWNDMDATKKCPATCAGQGRTWTGQWVTTVPGRMSVCECAR